MSLAFIIPVLKRPHRVTPLLDAIHANTPEPFSTIFICNTDDYDELEAILDDGRFDRVFTNDGGYAVKVNMGVEKTSTDYVALWADDMEPLPGWWDAVVASIQEGAEVVGLNDQIYRSRQHSTAFVMTREYAERPILAGEPGPLCTLYDHSCSDDELIATATDRGVYAYAEDAKIDHFHPDVGTAPLDDVYRKGRAKIREDRKLWKSRKFWYLEQ